MYLGGCGLSLHRLYKSLHRLYKSLHRLYKSLERLYLIASASIGQILTITPRYELLVAEGRWATINAKLTLHHATTGND